MWKECSLALLLLLLVLLYGLNAFGNLRLNNDAIALLSSAVSSAQGSGQVFRGHSTVFPPGYPFLVELQLRSGIASSYSLVLLNSVFLWVGVVCFVLLLRTSFSLSAPVSLLFGAFVMLNWIIIKHTPLPLTDIPYFGLALLSLWVMERARTARMDGVALSLFLLGGLLIFASIGVRRVGISLLPVWIAALATRRDWVERLLSAPRLVQIAVAVALLVAIGTLGAWFYSTATLRDYPALSEYFAYTIHNPMSVPVLRASEAGEAVLNIPKAKMPLPIFVLFGAIAVVLSLIGLLQRRRLGLIETYFLAYAAILIVWPWPDPRYLIPIIPFLLVYAFIGTASIGLGSWRGATLVAWGMLYTMAGAAALFYSARITFSGQEFALLYGDGTLQPTYCYFLKTCPVENPLAVNADALTVLEFFQGK